MVPEAYTSDSKYGDYMFEKFGYSKIPEPSKNGGLYTGEEFAKGAKYSDVKIKADAFFFNATLNETPGSENQNVDNIRPGNNKQILNKYKIDEKTGIYCPIIEKHDQKVCAANSFSDNFSSY